MNYIDFKEKITLYLINELELSEKNDFEEAMNKNKEWKKLFLDIVENDKNLKSLPKLSTKPDFIINLNEKIDAYENKEVPSLLNVIKESVLNLNPVPALCILCLTLVISFSLFKINGFEVKSNYATSGEDDTNNYIATNDLDSLKSASDSLKNPILLISDDR